jgi:hypothetical protein
MTKWKMTDAILKRLVARIKKQISENPQGVHFTAARIFREALEAEECRAYDAMACLLSHLSHEDEHKLLWCFTVSLWQEFQTLQDQQKKVVTGFRHLHQWLDQDAASRKDDA